MTSVHKIQAQHYCFRKTGRGMISRTFGNYTFLRSEVNREVFIHIDNASLSHPDVSAKFTNNIPGLQIGFDFPGRPTANNYC